MIDLESFILIGGRSSRLGVDKAFVELGGVTLAERAARTAETAFPDRRVTFVAGAEAQFAVDAVVGLRRPMVADLRPGFGAWSGLHAALVYARTEWALVLACDYPLVSDEFLRFLAGCASEGQSAIVPVQPDGRLQPLCAFYRVEPMLAEIELLLETSPSMPPLVEFLDREQTRRVEAGEYSTVADADRLFLNINTPDDLARARVAK